VTLPTNHHSPICLIAAVSVFYLRTIQGASVRILKLKPVDWGEESDRKMGTEKKWAGPA